MRRLYPAIEPYDFGHLAVSKQHRVYYEQCGNPQGVPVLVVHGGPGGGCQDKMRSFFDPAYYRIILVDQRGCGRSLPFCCLEENNTRSLINDFEQIRQHCSIDRWMLFGGSWGTTLSIAYAQTHPERISQIILRGVFLATPDEVSWLFHEGGASRIYPEAWQQFIEGFTQIEQQDIMAAYHARFQALDHNSKEADVLARQCLRWESTMAHLVSDPQQVERELCDDITQTYSRIICHYAAHDFFLDQALLDGMKRCQHIPCHIVHGRHDVICLPNTAWDLHQVWPGSTLQIVPGGAHSAMDPAMINALVTACDNWKVMNS
ncbi:MAG: prolyl aminopeptidase [Coxiellaceae bacterium]|nr:prolyl aminopeptidase [Coxiellaceae bacterium]